MKRNKQRKLFATEAQLCAAFLAAAGDDWVAYAEIAGWDILLVRKADGFQVGVQAKLRLNLDVVNQALEDGWSRSATRAGPDCRAVLVPDNDSGKLDRVCTYVGLTIIRMRSPADPGRRGLRWFTPDLPGVGDWASDWYELAPDSRCRLPEYVPDVAAGARAPLQLTQWKVKAIKISVLIEERGFVTRKDFAHLNLDHRRWVAQGWVTIDVDRYVRGDAPNFKAQHPVVYEQVKRDIAKWAPPVLKLDLVEPTRLPL